MLLHLKEVLEVLTIYLAMPQSSLTAEQSKRACNVLALFQCVASHPITKVFFTRARFQLYLYLFLSTKGDIKAFECVRLRSLGVLGALVKVPNAEVIYTLLSSEIIPICLHATEISRTLATFILQGLLQDIEGLQYVCEFPDQLSAVLQLLGNMVASLSEKPSVRLLKQVLKSYVHLLRDQRSLEALKSSFPERLSDGTFDQYIREDQTMRVWLRQLLDNAQEPLISQGCVINMSMWMLPVPKQL